MKKLLLLILTTAVLLPVCLQAQDRLPREFTQQDAIVVLDANTPFAQAVNIFNDYAQRLEGRQVVNNSGFTDVIGITIPGIHWFDALVLIANYNFLVINNFPDRIEITIAEEVLQQEQEQQRVVRAPGIPVYADTREVEISAVFFQGNRRFLREIGVDWTAIQNGRVHVEHLGVANLAEPQFNAEFNLSEVIGIGSDWEVSALLSALEANDKGEVLSSPKIKVIEGEVGRIQVGQDFSIKQRDFAGNVIDEFFETGTILNVTPYIIKDKGKEFIYMEIDAERSSATPGATTTIVNKQEAQTRVLLLSGETTAIAGLYETEENRIRRGIPFLKDLPPWFFGLRYLFGYESTEFIQNELVVIITAELVPTIEERIIDGSTRMDFIQQELERRRSDLNRD